MASIQTLEGMQELANSLSQEEIPVKLRCATCNKLVLNAFKLPCCDQSICEPCHRTLPDACPICDHSPLSADDAKPHKNLRLTVKAFLKAEEKKRDKERGTLSGKGTERPTSTVVSTPVVASVEATPARVDSAPPAPTAEHGHQEDSTNKTEGVGSFSAQPAPEGLSKQTEVDKNAEHTPLEAQEDSIKDETVVDEKAEHVAADDKDLTAQGSKEGPDGAAQNEGQDHSQMWSTMNGTNQQQTFNGGFGFDPSQAGFQNMGWNNQSGFNPMMQMGMPGGSWNNFNMMGMPNMNMDPMSMSQGMFGGGFGGQNMGMNGMNSMSMGMGFNGGFNNGWNGPMNGGGFGANAGFYPESGYNQQSHQRGNYAHQMHNQQYSKNNYQNNRFNGQGGYQRGFGRDHQENFGDQNDNHTQEQSTRDPQTQKNDDKTKTDDAAASLEDASQGQGNDSTEATHQSESLDEKASANSEDQPEKAVDVAENKPDDQIQGDVENETNVDFTGTITGNSSDQNMHEIKAHENGDPQYMQQNQSMSTYEQGDPSYNMDPNGMHMSTQMGQTGPNAYNQGYQGGSYSNYPMRGRGGMRGYGRGGYDHRGGYGGRGGRYVNGSYAQVNASVPTADDVTILTPEEPKGVGVVGAPTGPKAMREGLPNTGYAGRMVAAQSRPQSVTTISGDQKKEERSRSPGGSRSRPRSPSRERSRSRSRERSREKSQSRSHKHRRHYHSRSASETSESRKKHRHRSFRNHDEDHDENDKDRSGDSHREHRSRASSIDSRVRSSRDKDRHRSKRHRHRSRSRSPQRENEERANGENANSDSEDHRKRRSRRERSRSRSRDRDRRRRRDRSQEGSSDDRHHRSSRRSRKDRDRDRDHDYDRERDEDRESSRSYARDKERNRERERERDQARDRDHDRLSKSDLQSVVTAPKGPAADEPELKIHGRSRMKPTPISTTSSMPPPPTHPRSASKTPQSVFAPPTGPSADRARKEHRRRGSNTNSVPATPATPSEPSAPATPVASVDPHQEERERRNRERLLKEQQRRSSLNTEGSGRKRSRDEAVTATEEKFAPPTGPRGGKRVKAGKKDRRWEEDAEERARRVESEREAARWE